MQPDSQQTQPHGWASLEERYEVMKDIGDGSFGSVALARVRTAGASQTVRRGTMVCSTSRMTLNCTLTRSRWRSKR